MSTGVARPPARRRRRQASDNLEEGCDRKRRTSLRWKTSPEAPLLLFFFRVHQIQRTVIEKMYRDDESSFELVSCLLLRVRGARWSRE